MAALSPLDMLEQDIQQIHDVRPPSPNTRSTAPGRCAAPKTPPSPRLDTFY